MTRLAPVLRCPSATIACVAACALPCAAFAEDRPLWEIGLGAAALRLPHYRGSDESKNWLLPVPFVVYRGEIFKADREGARAVFVDTDRLDLDVSLGANAPTESKHDDARAGMSDLDATFEIGPRLVWKAIDRDGWTFQVREPLRAVFTVDAPPKSIGWTATPTINYDTTTLLSNWNLGVQVGPVFASRGLDDYFYGVPAEDAIPGRPAYRASGGYAGVAFAAALSRRFDRWRVGMFAKYDDLHGTAFDASPLLRDRGQWSIGIAFTAVLATSSRMVHVDE